MPLADDVDLDEIARTTYGFDEAFEATRPSTTPEMEDEYKRVLEQLKQEGLADRGRLGFQVSAVGDGAGG